MAFTIKQQDNVGVLTLKGRILGSIEGPKIKEGVLALRDAGQTNLVVDLSKATFMDSTTIGSLISILKIMREADGDVRLAGMDKKLKNIFLMTKLLGNVFENHDSVEEAAQSFK